MTIIELEKEHFVMDAIQIIIILEYSNFHKVGGAFST